MGDTPCYTCKNKYPAKAGCPACGGTGQARHGMPDSQPPSAEAPECYPEPKEL